MEHTNYSLAVLKIANNCVCVCMCEEGVRVVLFFASALPWQPGFAGERLPFFFKRFFALTSKETVHTDAADCILFVFIVLRNNQAS